MSTEVIEIREPSLRVNVERSSSDGSSSRLENSNSSPSFKNSLTLPVPNIGLSKIRRKKRSLFDTPDTPATPQTPGTPLTPRGDLRSELTDLSDDRSQYYDPETEFDEITERFGLDEEADALLEDQQEMAAELMFEEREDINSQQKRLAQEFLRDEYHFEQEKAHLKEYMKWRRTKKKQVVDNLLSRIRDMILNYDKYWTDIFLSLFLYLQTLGLLWVLPLRYPQLFLKYSWWIKGFNFDFISYRPEIGEYMSYPLNEWVGYDYVWYPPFMSLHLIFPLILLVAWYLSPRYGFLCCKLCCNERFCLCVCGICCFCCHKRFERCCEDKKGKKGGQKIARCLSNMFEEQWKYVVEKILFYVLLIIYTPVLITLLYHGFCLTEGNCLRNCWMICPDGPAKFWCLAQSLPSILVGAIYAVAQPILIIRELRRLNVHKINRKHLQYLRNMEVEKGLGISNDYVVQRLHISSSFTRLGGFYYYIVKLHLRPLLLIACAMILPKMDADQEDSSITKYELGFAIFTFIVFILFLSIEIFLRPYRLNTRFIIEVILGITILISITCCWMKTLDLQNAFLVDNSLFVMMMVIHVVSLLFVLSLLLIFLCFRIGRWPIRSKVIKNLSKRFSHYLKGVEDGKLLYEHALTTTPSFVRCDLLNHQRILLQKFHKEAILMDNPLSSTLENMILKLESEYYANESMSLMPQRKLQEKIGELRMSLDKRMEEMVLIPQRNRILMLKIMAYNAFRKMAGRTSLIPQEFDGVQKKSNVVDNLFEIVVTGDKEEKEEEEDIDMIMKEEEDGEENSEEEEGESEENSEEEEEEGEIIVETLEEEDDRLMKFENYQDGNSEEEKPIVVEEEGEEDGLITLAVPMD